MKMILPKHVIARWIFDNKRGLLAVFGGFLIQICAGDIYYSSIKSFFAAHKVLRLQFLVGLYEVYSDVLCTACFRVKYYLQTPTIILLDYIYFYKGCYHGTFGNLLPYFTSYMRQVKTKIVCDNCHKKLNIIFSKIAETRKSE